jgi:sugar lactone lactonase YvrE
MNPLRTLLAPWAVGAAVLGAAALPADEAADRISRLEDELRTAPDHGGILFRLARERALQGDAPGSIRDLGLAVATGLDLEIENESAFLPLRNRRDFMDVLDRALDQRVVVRASTVAFRVPETDLIPEGLAHDPVSGDFFLGSIHKRKIVRIGPDGKARDFTTSGQDGLSEVLGMRVDATRRLLWVMTAAGKAAGAQEGWSAAYAYDLGSGQVARRYPLNTGKHLFNDLALAADGRVFLTDSEAGAVWRIDPGTDALAPLVPARRLNGPNGIALSANERYLYVADFASGISIVDARTGDVRPLPHPQDVSLQGIDGLYWHESGLIGVQNGAGTERIVRYRLGPDGARVVALDVLESHNPLFAIPTTGVIVGGDFYYIANSLLDRIGPDGRLKPYARLEPAVILKTRLGPVTAVP